MKKCIAENCNRDVFSHLYCHNHQHLRTDDKALKLKNISSNNTIIPKTKIKAKFKAPTGQLDVFKSLWEEMPHVSEVSGKPLMFDVQCFHHILTKQAYPKFLLFKPNIILLTRDEHRQIHALSFEDLIRKDSYQKLKEMYNNG